MFILAAAFLCGAKAVAKTFAAKVSFDVQILQRCHWQDMCILDTGDEIFLHRLTRSLALVRTGAIYRDLEEALRCFRTVSVVEKGGVQPGTAHNIAVRNDWCRILPDQRRRSR